MEPQEFAALVRAIREAESALGNGAKVPVPSERDTARVARRGVVAKRAIARGAKLELDDLDVKRPEAGPSPLDLWDLVGKTASKDHAPDEPIEV
jgi:sialic acid synthase SpsE